jgi:EpsI family protein
MDSRESKKNESGRVERWQTVAICVLFVLVGTLAWGLTLKPPLTVDTSPLEALPYEISGWPGLELPMEDEVTQMLNADFNLQRAYQDPAGGYVWLYVGYYGTDRGGKAEHTPWICYPSQGWVIRQSDTVVVDEGLGLVVNEILVERADETRLVHFWYRSHRGTGIQGPGGQLVDRMLGRLLGGRADGGFVRVATTLSARVGIYEARAKLQAFGVAVEALLASHWPDEHAGES